MRTKSVHIDNFRAWVAGIILVIFAWYYANTVLFVHNHVINGATIVHSHIYAGDHAGASQDGEAPPHTKSQLTLISALGHYNAETPTEFVPLVAEYIELQDIYVGYVAKRYDNVKLDIQSRGPPSLSI